MFALNFPSPVTIPHQHKTNKPSLPLLRAKSNPEKPHQVPEDIPLPRGVWWLRHTNVQNEAIFGDSFVIHRNQERPLDLVVVSPEDTTVQIWMPQMTETGLIPVPYRGLLPPEFASEGMTIDVEILNEEVAVGSDAALVLVGRSPVVDEEVARQSANPRRTQKVKFTCNRCQKRTEKFINPHAWNHGVVFCRCEGCKVVHLIQDRKGMFFSLKGPIFPQKLDPEKIKLPKGIPQCPERVRKKED